MLQDLKCPLVLINDCLILCLLWISGPVFPTVAVFWVIGVTFSLVRCRKIYFSFWTIWYKPLDVKQMYKSQFIQILQHVNGNSGNSDKKCKHMSRRSRCYSLNTPWDIVRTPNHKWQKIVWRQGTWSGQSPQCKRELASGKWRLMSDCFGVFSPFFFLKNALQRLQTWLRYVHTLGAVVMAKDASSKYWYRLDGLNQSSLHAIYLY